MAELIKGDVDTLLNAGVKWSDIQGIPADMDEMAECVSQMREAIARIAEYKFANDPAWGEEFRTRYGRNPTLEDFRLLRSDTMEDVKRVINEVLLHALMSSSLKVTIEVPGDGGTLTLFDGETTEVETLLGWKVDYGDGNFVELPAEQTKIPAHTYAASGTYEIRVEHAYFSKLGDECFKGVTGLKAITLPETVAELGARCFQGCTGLTNVEIPQTVKKVGESCFNGIDNLKVTIKGSTGRDGTSVDPADAPLFGANCTVRVANAENYLLHGVLSPGMKVVFTEDVAFVGDRCCAGCTGLVEVTFSDLTKDLGSFAFAGCTGLMAVTIPESVEHVYRNCFADCNGLAIDLKGQTGRGNADCIGDPNDDDTFGSNATVTLHSGADYMICNMASENLTVVFADEVTEVGQWFAWSNVGLKTVVWSPGMAKLEYGAFSSCTNLSVIDLFPDSFTSIEASAFSGCTSLNGTDATARKNIVIPSSVVYMGANVFSGVEYLNVDMSGDTGAAVPYGTDNWTYRSLGNLFGDHAVVTVHSSKDRDWTTPKCLLCGIGADDFKIVIDTDTVRKLDAGFAWMSSGLVDVDIPEGVTFIGTCGFTGCTGLTEVVLPTSLKELGNRVFEKCTNVTTFTYPDGPDERGCYLPPALETLGNLVFNSCTGLNGQVVDIPESVRHIDNACFTGCADLTVELRGYTGKDSSWPYRNTYEDKFGDRPLVKVYHAVDCQLIGVYSLDMVVKVMPGNERVGDYFCAGCIRMKSVDLDNAVDGSTDGRVTALGNYAFARCEKMTSIAIPDYVETIGNNCFEACTGLNNKTVTLPASVKSIGESCFASCSGITFDLYGTTGRTYATIKSDLFGTRAKVRVFSDATHGNKVVDYLLCNVVSSDLSVELDPATIQSIGVSAFEGCTGIQSVVIPDGVTEIGKYAFAKCHTTYRTAFLVSLPPSIQKVGDGCFEGCQNVRCDIYGNLGRDANSHATDMFGTGARLTIYPNDDRGTVVPSYFLNRISSSTLAVGFQGGITELAERAVPFCGGLGAVEIPESVTKIGDECFIGANNCDYNLYGHTGRTQDSVPSDVWGDGAWISYYGVTEIPAYSQFNVTTKDMVILVWDFKTTKIGDSAFENCIGLTEVSLGEYPLNEYKVTEFGKRAFFNCNSLKHFTIAPPVKKIGDSCFEGCENLDIRFNGETGRTEDSVPNDLFGVHATIHLSWFGVPYANNTLPANLFRNVVSDDLKIIVEDYDQCKIETIGDSCFRGCTGLVALERDIEYDHHVFTELKDHCFADCVFLTGLDVPNVQKMGVGCFDGCSGLKTFELSKSISTIPDSCFRGCSSLTDLFVPDNVTAFGDGCFKDCTLLREIRMPRKLEVLGVSAFENCRALEELTLAATVETLGERALCGCTGLKYLTMRHEPKYAYPDDFLTGVAERLSPSPCIVYVPIDIRADYENDPKWQPWLFRDIYKPMVLKFSEPTTVFGGTMARVENLYDWEIEWGDEDQTGKDPDRMTKDQHYLKSHRYAAGEYQITLTRANLVSLSNETFDDCYSLLKVDVPGPVTTIGDACFQNCTNLVAATLPATLNYMGASCFSGCRSLMGIVVPNKVESLYGETFKGCAALSSVVIGSSVGSLGSQCFAGCPNLKAITIPGGVGFIGSGCFADCEDLVVDLYGKTGRNSGSEAETLFGVRPTIRISLPDDRSGVLDAYSFYRITAEGLTVTLDETVRDIGDHCFEGCTGLSQIGMAEVEQIGTQAFAGDTLIESVTFPDSLTMFAIDAFRGCTGIRALSVEEGNPKYDSRENCNAIIETETNTLVLGCATSTVPADVVAFGDASFYGVSGLEELAIPQNTVTVGKDAFKDCTGLKRLSVDNDAILSVASDSETSVLMTAKASLEEVTFGEHVTELGESCLADCVKLANVAIPNTVVSLGAYCFKGCTSIAGLMIPSGIETISAGSLQDCRGLKTLVLARDDTAKGIYVYPKDPVGFMQGVPNGESGCIIYAPKSLVDKYKADANWKNWVIRSFVVMDIRVKAGTTLFKNEAAKVTLGSSGNWILSYGDGVVTTQDRNTKYIPEHTYLAGGDIQVITGNADITEFGENCFKDCAGLQAVRTPQTLTVFGSHCFDGCVDLEEVGIAETNTTYHLPSVQSLPEACFAGCRSLNRLLIGTVSAPIRRFKTLGSYCFDGCEVLKGIDFTPSAYQGSYDPLVVIPAYCFRNCKSMVADAGKLTWSAYQAITTRSIGEYAFYGCEKITGGLNGVGSVGAYAFAKTSISSTNFGFSSVGNYCFQDCKNLKTVALNNLSVKPNTTTFDGCSGITFNVSVNQSYNGGDIFKKDALVSTRFSNLTLTSITSENLAVKIFNPGEWMIDSCSGLTKVIIDYWNTGMGSCDILVPTGTWTLPAGTRADSVHVKNCQNLKTLEYTGGYCIHFWAYREQTRIRIENIHTVNTEIIENCGKIENVVIRAGLSEPSHVREGPNWPDYVFHWTSLNAGSGAWHLPTVYYWRGGTSKMASNFKIYVQDSLVDTYKKAEQGYIAGGRWTLGSETNPINASYNVCDTIGSGWARYIHPLSEFKG